MKQLTLYKTQIDPTKNMAIDEINRYLQTCEPTSTFTMQYIPIKMEMNITLQRKQTYENFDIYNYMRILNDGEDSRYYYYFIKDIVWASSDSLTFHVVMDTINTFKDVFELDKRTLIQRQHRDRFDRDTYDSNAQTLNRKIDLIDEGINPILYKDRTIPINDTFNDKFWLYYKNRDSITPENLDNPVDCFLVSKKPLIIKKQEGTYGPRTFTDKDIPMKKAYYIDNVNNPGVRLAIQYPLSTTEILTIPEDEIWNFRVFSTGDNPDIPDGLLFTKYKYRKDGDSYVFDKIISNDVVISITFYQSNSFGISIKNIKGYYEITSLTERLQCLTGKAKNIKTLTYSNINKASPQNIKLIRLPYTPSTLRYGADGNLIYDSSIWEFDGQFLKLKQLDAEFLRVIPEVIPYTDAITAHVIHKSPDVREMINEPKLLNSSFFKRKIVYDSFEIEIPFELYKGKQYVEYYGNNADLIFKMTNTINSNFLFKINLDPKDWLTPSEYPFTLICKRNNEEVLFNSAYINYIQNGYNYDRKTLERQQVMNWLSTGVNLAGGAIGFAIGGFGKTAGLGLVTSAITSVASNINARLSSEQAIQQKLQTAKNSAVGISGNDDIDLMTYYCDNLVNISDYKCSDEMKKSLFDLFYYFGYSYPFQDKPDLKSRKWFNYIQCDPKFTEDSIKNIKDVYLNDIVDRFKLGVTYYHYRPEASNSWDLDQTLENWEAWIK